MATARRPGGETAARRILPWRFPLTRRNWQIIGAGIGLIVVGFALMAIFGAQRYDHPIAIVVAPIVLVFALPGGYPLRHPQALSRRPHQVSAAALTTAAQ
jgi:CBS-domain-containing membrane protein